MGKLKKYGMIKTIDSLRNKWKDVAIQVCFGIQSPETISIRYMNVTYIYKNKTIEYYFEYDKMLDMYNELEYPIIKIKNEERENKLKRIII